MRNEEKKLCRFLSTEIRESSLNISCTAFLFLFFVIVFTKPAIKTGLIAKITNKRKHFGSTSQRSSTTNESGNKTKTRQTKCFYLLIADRKSKKKITETYLSINNFMFLVSISIS